jgi:DNA repair protein RadC
MSDLLVRQRAMTIQGGTMTIEELTAAGGEEWKEDTQHRINFNVPALSKLIHFEVQRSEAGKISGGTLKGQPLSNIAARKIYAALMAGKFFYDMNDIRFHYDPLIEEYAKAAINTLRGKTGEAVVSDDTARIIVPGARRVRKNEPLIGLKSDKFTYVRDLFVSGPNDVAEIYQELKSADREKFIVMALDKENKLIGTEVVSMGTLNYNLVHPREVFKTAIMLGAAKIVCLHNHPSGTNQPSDEDISLTKRLHACGNIIGVELAYHVIVGHNEWSAIYGDCHIEKERLYVTEAMEQKAKVPEYEVYQKIVKHGAMILKPSDAVEAAKHIFEKNEKANIVFMLNTRNEVLTILDFQSGSNAELLKRAICVNAASMVVCTGEKYDTAQLSRIIKDTKNFGIELLDMVEVIGKDANGHWQQTSHKQSGTLREPQEDYAAISESSRLYKTEMNASRLMVAEEIQKTDQYKNTPKDIRRENHSYPVKDLDVGALAATVAGAELKVNNPHLLQKVDGLEDLKDKYSSFMDTLTKKITEADMFEPMTKKKIVDTLNSEAGAKLIAQHSEQAEVVIYAGLCMAEGGTATLEKYPIPAEIQKQAASIYKTPDNHSLDR